jgi:hypothetical protein
MREAIRVGSPVAARCGHLEDPKRGKVRQERALKLGRVAESVGFNEWRVLWDDGAASPEKSNCLKLQPNNAAFFSPRCVLLIYFIRWDIKNMLLRVYSVIFAGSLVVCGSGLAFSDVGVKRNFNSF